MKKASIFFTLLTTTLISFTPGIFARMSDQIPYNYYYDEEIFHDEYLQLYNSWVLTGIAGGITGNGYEPDFDLLEMDSIGIFRIYRNDTLFIYGKIIVEEQDENHLLISLVADSISGGISFYDMHKYVFLDSSSLALIAPCCDRYNYHFSLQTPDSIVYIPDAAFLHALIEEGVDTNEDGKISYVEAEAVTSLNVGDYTDGDDTDDISDLTGIEAFVNLDTLACTDNLLTNLDVSNNTALILLICNTNQLTTLDITNNTALQSLNCWGNQLTTLDVTNNTALTLLSCGENQLTTLDVSKNTALSWLYCGDNQLTTLDFSNNTVLTSVMCSNNQLTALDVSNNTVLTVVECSNNQLTTLDVTNNTDLTRLWCGQNQITSLDISNNTSLGIECGWFCGGPVDLSYMPSLYEVCVWTTPFPPDTISVDTTGSPNVYFTTECTIGIDESQINEFTTYPNPTYEILTIETTDPGQGKIRITSLNGQLKYIGKMEGTTHQIDMSSFSKGVYFVTVRSKAFVRTEKIVKL